MRNFIAVLKDSFREAVDGFVIYIMLGLSTLAIILIASIGFKSADESTTFKNTVNKFAQAFRNRGTDSLEIGTRAKLPGDRGYFTTPLPMSFTTSDVQRLEGKGVAGKYSLTLEVKSDSGGARGGWMGQLGGLLKTDQFRTLVASWSESTPQEQEYIIEIPQTYEVSAQGEQAKPKTIPKMEPVPEGTTGEDYAKTKAGQWQTLSMPKVNPASLKKVDDATMCEFIKQQFALHGDMRDVEVSRVPNITEPDYKFDVNVNITGQVKGWNSTATIFFGTVPLMRTPDTVGAVIIFVQDFIVNTIGATVILLVSVILTSFFIPNLMKKGAVDLQLAKPISRWELLLYKYIGGLTFIFLVVAYTIGGVWLVMALNSGVWDPNFLMSIPILMVTFAVLYALSTLIGVLTRSAIASIVIVGIFMFSLWGVGVLKTYTDIARNMPAAGLTSTDWLNTASDILNAGLPRYNDLLKLNSRSIADGVYTPAELKRTERLTYPSWGVALGVTFAYIVGFVGLAYLRFATRDP